MEFKFDNVNSNNIKVAISILLNAVIVNDSPAILRQMELLTVEP